MDFGWTTEQEDLFAAARVASVEEADKRSDADGRGLDREGWQALAEFGLLGMTLPTEYGGRGLDLVTTARTVEGFGESCRNTGLLFSASAHLFACCTPIATSGSEDLKRRTLPLLASGEWIGANAITEVQAGSDVLALETRAERQGTTFRLNGSKAYVTNGPVADVAVVYALTDPNAGPLSISAFAVELDAPGIAIDTPLETTGLRGASISAIHFEDCMVPAANLVGSEGHGALIFETSMRFERACLFAGYLGAMQWQLDQAVEFASSRHQFGRAIGKNQAVSHRIVDMKLRLESARHLVYHACWLLDRGENAQLAVALAKLAVSEAAVQSGIDAIQIHGGLGILAGTGVDRGLLDALPATIFSGTSEMQREIVARRLGL